MIVLNESHQQSIKRIFGPLWFVLKSSEKKIFRFFFLQGPRTAKSFEQWLTSLASTESLSKLAKQVQISLK